MQERVCFFFAVWNTLIRAIRSKPTNTKHAHLEAVTLTATRLKVTFSLISQEFTCDFLHEKVVERGVDRFLNQ